MSDAFKPIDRRTVDHHRQYAMSDQTFSNAIFSAILDRSALALVV